MDNENEKVYFMVLSDHFIIFPGETGFILKLPKKALDYIFSAEIKKIALFFQSSKDKTISAIGILCEIKENYRGEKDGGLSIGLTPIARIKTQDRDSLAQINGYIGYEIVKNDFDDCSKEYMVACFSEIIDQIDNIQSNEGKVEAFYMIFISPNKITADLENQEITVIYQGIVNDFCDHPEKLVVWIDFLFNQTFNDDLRRAKWHVLNELNIITRFEVLIENFVPLICEFINQKYSAPEKKQLPVSASGKNKNANSELTEMEVRIRISGMPEGAKKVAEDELKKMKRIGSESNEYAVSMNYLDWLLAIPWGIYTQDNFDIKNLKKCLDDDHFGLERVKNRVVEHIAAQSLNPGRKAPVFCFVGPPGTGKTSIAHSIANALGRKRIDISLGSLEDPAELKGHRRTYIGSIPGKIIDGLKRAGSSNPVIVFDEIDKLSKSIKGDPAAVLLEVLDPEQNYSFRDHYLDVPVDLSKILFITTANILDTIPPALLNRLEVIEFSSYLDVEKLEIAKKYLIPRRIKENGLDKFDIKFTDHALLNIIRFYLREPGVRKLERKIDQICRKLATRVVEENLDVIKNNIIDCGDISSYLGIQKFSSVELIDMEPGLAIGLAYMEEGYGSILHIEVVKTRDYEDKYKFTGSIGPVMKESLGVIISCLYRNREKLGLKKDDFRQENGIHVHVPEAAVPKEGPSAGITICAAIYSCLTNKKLRKDVAFTGEITLMGRILPVGGLREKTLSAKRAGIKTIILSEGNKKNIEELESYIKDGVNFIFVSKYTDVLIEHKDVIFDTEDDKNNSKDGK